MRTAEWINLLAFAFLMILAGLRQLPEGRRLKALSVGAGALMATLAGAFLIPRLVSPLAASVLRDWLPYPLLLLYYWQAGQFFTRVDLRPQQRLVAWDRRLVTPVLSRLQRHRAGRWTLTVFETAYLFCYPLLAMALGAMYLMRKGGEADHFWMVVLIATDFCYALLPFIQTEPPRVLPEWKRAPAPSSPVRSFNLWILKHASIHANTFPSAHVASSMACALGMLRLSTPVGLIFLAIAVCIAMGAVAGRYHYAADIVFGMVAALAAYWLAGGLWWRP